MAKIVIELQRDSLNISIPIEDVLRKALAVSVKINNNEIEEWLNSELNGYDDYTKVPDYRKIVGVIKAFNPYQGWIPVVFPNDEFRIQASTQILSQPIGELNKLSTHKNLHSSISSELRDALCEENGVDFDIRLFASPASIIGVMEKVRNIVLNWALALERSGVLGEDMDFTKEEKEKAYTASYTVINNIGVMSNSQIQQFSDQSLLEQNSDLINNIIARSKDLLNECEANKDIKDELQIEISTIELQNNSPKPKKTIIYESLKSIRNIAEGMTGSLIASGLIGLISKIITS